MGILFEHTDQIETVVIGDHNGRKLIVLGSNGEDNEAIFNAARRLADLIPYEGSEAMIVDVVTHSVRPAHLVEVE